MGIVEAIGQRIPRQNRLNVRGIRAVFVGGEYLDRRIGLRLIAQPDQRDIVVSILPTSTFAFASSVPIGSPIFASLAGSIGD